MRHLVFLILISSALISCAPFAPDQTVMAPAGLPAEFSLYSSGQGDYPQRWWEDFASPELNTLINTAISDNFSIREAWARLEQAELAAGKAKSAASPTLNANAGGAYTEKKGENTAKTNSREWTLGLSAGYEIDLWGRIRAEKESAAHMAMASAEDLKASIMTITGQIAETWLLSVSNQKQQELFSRQIDLQKQLLELIKSRFSLARSTALDIYQQQQSIESLQTTLISLKGREGVLKRQLAFLTGAAALDERILTAHSFPAISALPSPGLPADLLANRPDVIAAGLRLKSARWDSAAARADRLPALKLTASHTYSGESSSVLFDNWLRNLAVNLTAPLLDGRKRTLEVDRRVAVEDERVATYGKTVFQAIKEVEDAMAAEEEHRKRLSSLNTQLALSERTIREAKRRYLQGNSDFLNVLREQLNILAVQRDIITATEEMLSARVRLYRNLGGSWINHPVPAGS